MDDGLCNMIIAIANAGATILALISLLITVKEQKRIHNDEQKRNIVAQKMMWYNQIVLEDIVKQLTKNIEIIDREIEKVGNILTDNEGNDLYNIINVEMRIFAEKLMIVKMFNIDAYKECKCFWDSIWDCYADIVQLKVERLQSDNGPEMAEIQDYKRQIIEVLYDYGNKRISESN